MPLQAEGEFAQVKKRLETALGLSGQPVKRGTMAHMHIVYMMIVDAAATARETETIEKYGPLLEELAIRDEHQPYLAISRRANGVAHRLKLEFDQAEKYLLQALEFFESAGMPWQQGRTLYELGELALEQKNNSLCQERFTQALEIFDRILAKPDSERTKKALIEVELE